MLGMFLQVSGFFGGSLGDVLNQWEQAGIFSYALPFLLIFALIFGLLQKLNIFENKAVNGIIAISVGLMALQFGFVSVFFSDIFPQLGVGLAVVLIGLILLGLFMDSNQTGIMFGIGAVAFIIILWNSFDFGNTNFGFWFSQNWLSVTIGVIIIGTVLALIFGFPEKKDDNMLSQLIKPLK